MDVKSTKAYGKMKVPGVALEYDYSDSGGIVMTLQQVIKDLAESKKSFKGEIVIRLSPSPIKSSPESDDMIEAMQRLDIISSDSMDSMSITFNLLWDTDELWRLAMKLNHPANRESSTKEQRVKAYNHYLQICNLNPGLAKAYPIHWMP